VAALPAVLLAVLIALHATDVPTWDEWDTPGRALVAAAEGRLTWGDLYAQHNESRKVLPRLAYVAAAPLVGWDTRHSMAVTYCLAIILSIGVMALARRTVPLGGRARIALWLLSNILLFSPAQFDNWLMGLQWIVLVPATCVVWGLYLLEGSGSLTLRTMRAAVLAIVATFTYAGGLLSWPVLGVAVALAPVDRRRSNVVPLAAWSALACAVLVAYFRDLESPGNQPSLGDNIATGLGMARHLIAYAGSIVAFGNVAVAQVVGLAVVALFVAAVAWAILRSDRGPGPAYARPWLLLGLFGLAEGVLIALGRSAYGVGQAITSRYTTHAALMVVSLLHVAAIVWSTEARARRSRPLLFAGLAATACLLLLSAASFAVGARAMANYERDRLEGKACLLLAYVAPEVRCLETRVYPSYSVLMDRLEALDGHGLIRPRPVRDIHAWFALPLPVPDRLEAAGRAANANGDGASGRVWIASTRSLESGALQLSGTARHSVGRPVDAVAVVGWCLPHGRREVLGVTRVGLRSATYAEALLLRPDQNDAWQMEIPRERIPACRAHFEAWAVDTSDGRPMSLHVGP
jgi:hypothetical protein